MVTGSHEYWLQRKGAVLNDLIKAAIQFHFCWKIFLSENGLFDNWQGRRDT